MDANKAKGEAETRKNEKSLGIVVVETIRWKLIKINDLLIFHEFVRHSRIVLLVIVQI